MKGGGIRFWQSRLAADILPVILGVSVALAYFMAVMPGSRQFLAKYILTALFLFVITRIPNQWYYRTRLLPPVRSYKRGKKQGKSFSKTELAHFYEAFTAHVRQSQILAIEMWLATVVLFAAIQYVWIQRSWASVVGVLFTGLISTSVAVAFTYFMIKHITEPLIEEVGAQLDVLPDVRHNRVSLFFKIGITVMAMTVLAFLAYVVLVQEQFTMALDQYALRAGTADARATASLLKLAPAEQWKTLLTGKASTLYTMAVVDGKGALVGHEASGAFDDSLLRGVFTRGLKVEEGATVQLLRHEMRLFPLTADRTLALAANPDSVNALMARMIGSGLLFLLLTVSIQGIYVLWLSRDTSRTLKRAVEANKRLAAGDLTRIPAIWSDDEMGTLTDNLRAAFQGLQRMTRELSAASVAVDEEVARTVGVTDALHGEISSQTASADRTTGSLKAMEEGMLRVSQAMEQVASATGEVSSTILQMQASVEEIARNSDVLIQSVEKTVSSSNEISASAGSVKASTEQLYQSGQEAVSFFAELDASLDETRRNARSLSDSASKVTQDAEAGFSAVAAVEDEILRTTHASEQSRSTLSELVTSIEKIGRTVDIIQDVTEQTNLLSLNASIIAAGAGEHGKSFAVVATQIRELSARTAGSAKEIRSVIRSLTKSGEEMAQAMDRTFQVVNRSTELSRGAGDALRTILESAASQEEMSKRIASATEELAHGGQSANRAMHGIFEMMEGITGATKDQVASTLYLNQEAERVRDVAFQLRNATEEQAKGTRVISQAITQIMEDSRQTTQAIQLQTKESGAIYDAMRQVAATAQSIEEGFNDLTLAADHLKASAAALRQEIRSFKTN